MSGRRSYRSNGKTGRFCAPGCTQSEHPDPNINTFASTRQALMHGYLPCIECQPMIVGSGAPGNIAALLVEAANNPSIALNEDSLLQRGIDPDQLRRWFQTTHDLTFQDYLRLQRVSVLCGTVRHKTGSETEPDEDMIVLTRLNTPLGPMLAGASSAGICLLEFMDRRMLETQLSRLNRYFGPNLDAGSSEYFDLLNEQLEEYFAGNRTSFSVPLDVPGTPFQTRAWTALMAIPYGETRSYQEQAVAIEQSAAVRAVARANGDNRISIVIPCHRVIGKDGSLTGYGGKLWRKRHLLDLEARVTGSGQAGLFPDVPSEIMRLNQ